MVRAQLLAPWTATLPTPPFELAITSPDYRRAMTAASPLRFALLYLPHHLRSPETGGVTSLAEHHITIAGIASRWRRPDRHRDIVIAPRYSAKSTWKLLVTAWALAHGHRRFALWVSDSAGQEELHLATLRAELETNRLLAQDYPQLLPPPRGTRGARDTQHTYTSAGGAAIVARGADTRSLGLKLGANRPDLICLDDLEPDASNYSIPARRKRLATVQNAILPMNEQAAVLWTGTVVMHGSILHAAALAAAGVGEPEAWIADEGFAVHHVSAIQNDQTGERRSFWEQRYSLTYLESIEHTLNYALNFAGLPPLPGGHHWTDASFRYGRHPVGALVMQIDPAPTAGPDSDFSAIVVGGRITDPAMAGHVSLEFAEQVRLTPGPLSDRVRMLLRRNPRIRKVRVAATGSGELWRSAFRDLPGGVELELHADMRASSGARGAPDKDLKFAGLLERYEALTVWHARRLLVLEDQLRAWPDVEHDDVGDCAAELVAELQK
jgi:hypothetical protein